jgi:hypothetical protein
VGSERAGRQELEVIQVRPKKVDQVGDFHSATRPDAASRAMILGRMRHQDPILRVKMCSLSQARTTGIDAEPYSRPAFTVATGTSSMADPLSGVPARRMILNSITLG